MRITAQDLYNYTKCKHRVYLDTNGDPALKGEVSSFVQMLWEMGLQTEEDYLHSLGYGVFRDLGALSIDQASAATLELMRSGEALIYQGVIRHGELVGRPDLLLRRDDAASDFGDYHYEAIDIKAGRGWEEKNGKRVRFKEHYAFQILFYRKILGEIQGYLPSRAEIINVEHQTEGFDPADFYERFEAAFEEVKALVSGVESSEPVLGSTCHQCPWFLRCRRWAETNNDPTLLFYVGRNKFQLKEAGLKTVQDIAAMDISRYLKAPCKIPRLGKTRLLQMQERAKVVLAGEPSIRPGYRFPETRREIYFDIEDDPTRDHTYLYGVVERDDEDRWNYRYFLAPTPDQEERAIREFWRFIAESEDSVFYVYSAKERSSLRRLMERYELEPTVFERYVASEFDLYHDLVVKYSDWPTYSYGIKNIARLIGFHWRDSDPGGANSIAWYNEYLEDPTRQNILQRILEYNEDDCRAMIAVKEYFEKRRGDEKA